MTVLRIYLAGKPGAPQAELESVRVTADAGIEGDRYFDAHDEPGQNLTLVEAEEIEAFFAERGRSADLSCTRRNIVTRGVRRVVHRAGLRADILASGVIGLGADVVRVA